MIENLNLPVLEGRADAPPLDFDQLWARRRLFLFFMRDFAGQRHLLAPDQVSMSKLTINEEVGPHTLDEERILDPDDLFNHAPRHHEFGVLGHTAAANRHWQEIFATTGWLHECLGPDLLGFLIEYFAQEIDGRSKKDLVGIALFFHDIAKLVSPMRPSEKINSLETRNHCGHEQLGADFLLKYGPVRAYLMYAGVTAHQYKYIIDCVRFHYALGIVRREHVDGGGKFDLNYVHSEDFKQACLVVASQRPELAVEIGAIFLADNMAKAGEHELNLDPDYHATYLLKLDTRVALGALEQRLVKIYAEVSTNFLLATRYLEMIGRKS